MCIRDRFGGAGLGACLRWWLGLLCNQLFPTVPRGTLQPNLLGGSCGGEAVAYFAVYTSLPPELRLFIITGFMGGLTTFSAFSAEVVTLLTRGQIGWALVAAGAHLLGSLTLTALGILTVRGLLIRS